MLNYSHENIQYPMVLTSLAPVAAPECLHSIFPPCPSVAAFLNLPYSPTLLLASPFAPALSVDPGFVSFCEAGFDAYFEFLYVSDEVGNVTFVERVMSWDETVAFVIEESQPDTSDVSPAERAGFVLGWLSALALTQRTHAQMALVVFAALL